ncbi:hypothetical protein PG985_010478 [Apiospora marii]|uniref:uncharacterized protein n=1 Tax=Apiospora marii TaxID=335849 RepID=UPI003132001F
MDVGMSPPRLWITGVGTQYPPHTQTPETFEELAGRFYDVDKPGYVVPRASCPTPILLGNRSDHADHTTPPPPCRLQKLLNINRRTGIDARPAIHHYETGFGCAPEPPSIQALDTFFREHGVPLAAAACRKALAEWGGRLADITHTVAVTCTNQGTPGYDILVNRRLGLDDNAAERVLLHGVGCAGGAAVLRVASQLARGAAARGRPARILCYACELCTPNVRRELAEAEACVDMDRLGIAGILFSDGAAAFVLCNDAGLLGGNNDSKSGGSSSQPLFEVLECGNATLPDTVQEMSLLVREDGFRAVISRKATEHTRKAILPLFQRLCSSLPDRETLQADPARFDWALHPGGKTIIAGAQEELGLSDDQLRATREIYRTKGNSSSVSALAVLDLLRRLGRGESM